MKKLEMLGAKLLTKEEMNEVKGGTDYICSCKDGSATWLGSYKSEARVAERAAYWCVGGAICTVL
jgi:hypothetical protein